MLWNVVFCDEFDAEFKQMVEGLQDELLAHASLWSGSRAAYG